MGIYTLHKKLIIFSEPKIDPEHQIQQTVQTKREHELVLYNDDVNTFDHVINTLIAVCEHSIMQAQQCAYIVHFSGKCVVKTGSISDLEPRCIKLLEAGLSAEIV
jgi:ATP-dependent Clp protease adaptor protein ClpS